MFNNDNLLSKENWQNANMQPGTSHGALLNANISYKHQVAVTVRTSKQTWTCSVCKKELSSKRSYTEHMNIHNKTRPFRCDHCSYAAASQMTLHRHKLRNHTPKTEWGYRCPYCEEAYMEPAGYQQHVQQRHPGKSATYGCPFRLCSLKSKSQRHFREHLAKHDRLDTIEGGVDPCQLTNQQLTRYMINDEIGDGFVRHHYSGGGACQKVMIRARQPVGIVPKIVVMPATVQSAAKPKMVHAQPRRIQIMSHQPPPPPPPEDGYYHPESSAAVPSTPYYRQLAQPLPRSYDEIPQEFDVDVDDPSDFEAIQSDMEEEEGHDDEEEDDGPPVLNREELGLGDPMYSLDWVGPEVEIATNEVSVFPNGLIEEELD
uniref:C2H2-type domain-containing protein n=1 Tax=Caenorhabditis japonica TaxID=281687 RepID=A0A8R1DVG1_CAEJA